jgi:hypothetical protein
LQIFLIMQSKKHIIVLFFAFFYTFSHFCFAQLEMSAFTATGRGGAATTFATDYQAIGVNPANLGVQRSFRDPMLTFGFLEFNASFFSEGMTRGELAQSVFEPTSNNFSYADKIAAKNKFADKANSLNVDFMLFGAAIQLKKYGGFAFSIRDKIQFYAKLNPLSANILFLGHNSDYFTNIELSDGTRLPNSSSITPEQREKTVAGFIDAKDAKTYGEILNGSRFSMSWYREYNFSYGNKIYDSYNFTAHAGVGFKLVKGIALIDVSAENNQLKKDNIAVSKTLGITILDSVAVRDPNQQYEGFVQNATNLNKFLGAEPIATGYGIDLGINLVIRRSLYLGAAVTNLGNVGWESNTFKLQNDKLETIEGGGLNGYSILAASANTFKLAGAGAALKLKGSERITEALPSVIRVGGSYEYFRTFHVGLDVIIPRNKAAGNLENPLVTLGGEYRLTRYIRLSTGVSIGGNQARPNVPAGIVFSLRKKWFEAGIATRDVISYFPFANVENSTISFSSGFFRFKFF